MPLLYYWRSDNYRRDLDFGAEYHLNQGTRLLHSVDLGDTVWAFTRNSRGAYVLAAELVVKAQTLNSANFRYGRYRVYGSLNHSRYFKIEGQASLENILRALSCKTDAAVLGCAFQGRAAVRRITAQDHKILSEVARPFGI